MELDPKTCKRSAQRGEAERSRVAAGFARCGSPKTCRCAQRGEAARRLAVAPCPPLPGNAWVPLYLFCVLAATLFPFWLHCVPGELDLGPPILFDVAQNVLLFWPLGYALRTRSGLACIAVALLFSAAVELGQLWVLRSPSPWDVIANGLGAALGWRTAARLPVPHCADRLASLALLGAALLLAVSLYSAPRRLGNGFEEWQPMSLVIGNELSADRPWSGSIAELAVYDRASPEPPVWDEHGPPEWREHGPILWMRFQSPSSGRIDGPEGLRPFEVIPAAKSRASLHLGGLDMTGGLWVLPPEVGGHVFDRLKERGQIAVQARFSPASLDVNGPGRILSLSLDVTERGFTLGQSGADLVFRVRTPATSANGTRPNARTKFATLTPSEHVVWATYDGFRSRIEIDGVCRGERIISSKRGVGTLGEMLGVTLAAGSGLVAFAAAGRRRGAPLLQRVAKGCAAAALFSRALWAAGAWEHLPYFGPWAAALTAIAAGLGVRGGLALESRETPACNGG